MAGIGKGATGGGGGAAASILNPTALTNSQAALTRVGTQVDALQRRLLQLATLNPAVRLNTNFAQITAQAAALQTTIRDIAEQARALPPARLRLDTAQVRAELAEMQRAAAGLQAAFPPVTAATERLGTASAKTGTQTHGLLDSIKSIAVGLAVYSAFAKAEELVNHFAEAVIALPAAFEQAQIGFTAMLGGDRAAANQMLADLQRLANVTPFKFTGEQAATRELLGLGMAADKVLPELVDIDTAVAAIGGNEDTVLAVAAALGKMSAEGRVSAIFMNELTRNGIPAWVMLAESMGKSVAEVRALSENGQLASGVFERAFHEYTVRHWGDALAAQSQTFTGLISTAQDLGEQFLRTFGMPIIQELEPRLRGALAALQDPKIVDTITEWGQKAAEFVGWILDGAVALGQMLGLPTADLSTNMRNASDAVKQFAGDWSSVGDSIGDATAKTQGLAISVGLAERQIKRLRDAQEQANTATTATIAGMRDALTAQDRLYDDQLQKLRAQGDALERNHQIAKSSRDIARLQVDIAKDESRARNIFTASGQAAAKRLEDERQRLADLQDEQDYQNQRAANQGAVGDVEGAKRTYDQQAQDAITAIERRRQADDAATTAQIRNLQSVVDAGKAATVEERRIWATWDSMAIASAQTSQAALHAGFVATVVDATATGTKSAEGFTDRLGTGLTDWINTDLIALIDKSAPKLQEAGGRLAEIVITGITEGMSKLDWGKLLVMNLTNFSPPAVLIRLVNGGLDAAAADANAQFGQLMPPSSAAQTGDQFAGVRRDPTNPAYAILPNGQRVYDPQRQYGGGRVTPPGMGAGGTFGGPTPPPAYQPGYNGPSYTPQGVDVHVTVTVDDDGKINAIVNRATGGDRLAKNLGEYMRGQR